jgi:hypothetical protein
LAHRISEGKDILEFAIVERTKRAKHAPSPEETAAEVRRLKRRRQHWQSPRLSDDIDFDLRGPAYPEFDVICTEIVAGFKVLFATRKVRREQWKEKQRR